MTTRVLQQNAPARDSIRWWDDYAREDTFEVSTYLFESGEHSEELGDRTISPAEFTSQEFHLLETEGLWSRVWQVACRANDVPKVGDFIEYEIAGLSVVVVRDANSQLKAFRNACRHRGTALVTGAGNYSCFVCPFHGWTYDLDGGLVSIPAKWDFPSLDSADKGLTPVLVDVFDGWVFVNLDLGAEPLSAHLGETISRHLQVHPDANMWKQWHFGRIVNANWKVMAEAFFESYHVARTHPETSAFGGDVQSRYDRFQRHHRLTVPTMISGALGAGALSEQEILDAGLAFQRSYRNAEGQSSEVDASGANGVSQEGGFRLPEGMTARQAVAAVIRLEGEAKGLDISLVSDSELIDGIIYFLFPNFMTFRNPVGHHAYRFRPIGDGPDKCLFEVMSVVPTLPTQELPADSPMRLLGVDEKFADLPELAGGNVGFILDQDVSNGEAVQKGLRVSEGIVFAERQESNIVSFHQHLSAMLDNAGQVPRK